MTALASRFSIEAERLTKHFGPVRALEELDLAVDHGEVFGYLGPNGAGKTTTIRLLLDFLRPTNGSCRVLGSTGADTDVRRRIGYLPGELRLDPRYSAADVVDFFGALRGGVDRARVDELYERFDLDPHRPSGELSTGNRRKVGIVQAFMHRPDLLLLDEPTSGLDPLLQQEFRALVREEAGRGATVFLSSHVLPEVEVLAERVAILRKGRLVAVAGVHDLRREARQRIDLHVTGAADAAPFSVLPEVVEASATDGTVHVVVQGSVDRVIKTAAQLDVQRIVTHDDDLEDVFLSYFRGADTTER
jgi:ABC-2 type transport system ATP-binding protein